MTFRTKHKNALAYHGRHWGLFVATRGSHADGRPAICCCPALSVLGGGLVQDTRRDWFVITVARFIEELRLGGLFRCK
jgi:hypothetical protein